MGWLGGWDSRIEILIDHDRLDDGLVDFPVLIYLSSSSGITNSDLTSVFDELGSDANRKKIAVTMENGTTECKVEIERWDHSSEKAWLWVKVPNVYYYMDTKLYLYFDSGHSDNTENVGDIGSEPGMEVWSNGFAAVYHMNFDVPMTVKNSVSDKYHLIVKKMRKDSSYPYSAAELYEVEGKVGNAISFGDYDVDKYLLWLEAGPLLNDKDNVFTIEALLYLDIFPPEVTGYWGWGIASKIDYNEVESWICKIKNNGSIGFWGSNPNRWDYGTSQFETTEYSSASWVKTEDSIRFFKNGGFSNYVPRDGTLETLGQYVRIGRWVIDSDPVTQYHFASCSTYDGDMDEIRISYIARDDLWIKTTHYSNFDDLLKFGNIFLGSSSSSSKSSSSSSRSSSCRSSSSSCSSSSSSSEFPIHSLMRWLPWPSVYYPDFSVHSGNRIYEKPVYEHVDGYWRGVQVEQGKTAGKWYVELKIFEEGIQGAFSVGIAESILDREDFTGFLGRYYRDVGYFSITGNIYSNMEIIGSGPPYGNKGDVIGIAFDLVEYKGWFRKNGDWINGGDPANGVNESFRIRRGEDVAYHFAISVMSSCGNRDSGGIFGSPGPIDPPGCKIQINSTVGEFIYSVPEGFSIEFWKSTSSSSSSSSSSSRSSSSSSRSSSSSSSSRSSSSSSSSSSSFSSSA